MENENYIEFKQVRSFGDKVTASFEFLRMNFGPLMKSVLYIAGPLGILTSVTYILFMDGYMENLTNILQAGEEGFSTSFLSYFGIYMACYFLAMTLLSITTMEYVNLYNEKKGGISFNELWGRVGSRIIPTLLVSFLLFVLFVSFFGLFITTFITLFADGAMTFFLIFLLSIFMFYVTINLTVFLNIFINEKRSVGEIVAIIKRCFFLVKGKWWSTFGLLFIMSLIITSITFILQLPLIIFQMMGLFSAAYEGESVTNALPLQNLPEQVYTGATQFIGFMMYTLLSIGITFQYFNLVERKESSGLMEEIESIGLEDQRNKTASDADDEEDY